MGEGERRLERQDPFELLDGAIEIVMEVVEVPDEGFGLQMQRIQPLGLLELDDRPVELPLEKREPPRIPEMGGGRARSELEGARKSICRCLPDPSRGSWRWPR